MVTNGTCLCRSPWSHKWWGRRPGWTAARIVILVISVALLALFVFRPIKIVGDSMEPTFYAGTVGLLNVQAYTWRKPQRGDVIGFRQKSRGPLIIKRIIGMPGESIAFRRGTVWINGRPLPEPYLASPGAWEWPEESLPPNTFFVAGDNRNDSRQFRIQAEEILGTFYSFPLRLSP